ncbi:dihydrolipoyllysine-residue acetyltransferase [Pantoea sp. Mhis]|nr:dihydrolipoyllysine-residue acetyltransferase [Pantoea sp. Mhis]
MLIEIRVPDIGSDEVEVTEILVQVGDEVKVEQSLITVEGDKVSMEIPSPFAGVVKELKVGITDKVITNSLIMVFEINKDTSLSCASKLEIDQDIVNNLAQNDMSTNKDKKDTQVHATPLVRRLACKFGINLTKIVGSGRKGRILKEDIQHYIKDAIHYVQALPVLNSSNSHINMSSWPKVNFSKFGEVEEIKLSRIKKIAGFNLSRNWIIIPHVTHFEKSDITELELFRKQQNIEAEKNNLDIKFTSLVFIIKAVAVALKQMPLFNSSLSEDGQTLTLKKYINIGVAVDTPSGLTVPVFKNINHKGITELSRELIIFFKKARDNKLMPSDVQGGCFTISNLGSLGTTYFTPIVNAPEVAILGISKAVMEPVWNGKKFIPRLMMPISLSFDHRIIDGADGIRFINIINKILRDIRCLLM